MAIMARKNPSAEWTPERILALRKRLRLTQTAAAEKVGVSRRSWAAWEGGQKRPSRPVQLLLRQLDSGKI